MPLYVKSKFYTYFVARHVLKLEKNVNLREMKQDHRNCLDLSSGFPTIQDSNQPTQLQRLARMLKFCV